MPRPIDTIYSADDVPVALEEEIDVVSEEVSVEPQLKTKRHKKHKHKKHKRRKIDLESIEEIIAPIYVENKEAQQIVIEESVIEDSSLLDISQEEVELSQKNTSSSYEPQPSTSEIKVPGLSPKSSGKKKKKEKESGTSSDEERWLHAIESGKLEEVDDELKKIKPKDPKLMTARQRAMFERKTDSAASPGEQLLALPSGYREKVLTPEALQKKALKSQRRKQQADEKREKDKKKTMERLLKKQDSKSLKQNMAKSKFLSKKNYPCVSYKNTIDLITLSFPENAEFPLKQSESVPVPDIKLCGVRGCSNPKKYNCSKTKIPLCSFQCYQTNLLKVY